MEDNEKNRNHEEGRKHGAGKDRPKEFVQRLDEKRMRAWKKER